MSTPNLSHLTLPSLPFALRWMRFLLTISFVVLVSLNLPVGEKVGCAGTKSRTGFRSAQHQERLGDS